MTTTADDAVPTVALPDQAAAATEQSAPAADAKTQRLDRIMQSLEQIAPPFLQALLGKLGPEAEHVIYGGMHCDECRAARAALRTAVLDLEEHLETVHDTWPSSLDSSLDGAHKAVSQVSRSLRLIGRDSAPGGAEDGAAPTQDVAPAAAPA